MNFPDQQPLHNRWIRRFQNGDEEALKSLIRGFHPQLIRSISFYVRDRDAVDDIAQECWYAIIKQLTELNLRISFDAWALTIARRKAVDWIRQRQKERRVKDGMADIREHDPDEKRDRNEWQGREMERIQIGIEQLPPSQKVVIRLFYLENLKIQEIGSVLEVPEGTVKSRLYTAREALKQIMNNKVDEL